MSAIWETQKAVYAKLSAEPTLLALVEGIHDHVPEGNEYPYITIGDLACESQNMAGRKAYSMVISIGVFSRNFGRKEIYDVIEKVRLLLENQALAITGFEHVATSFLRCETSRLNDGRTTAGVMDFRIRVREA